MISRTSTPAWSLISLIPPGYLYIATLRIQGCMAMG